MMESIDASHSRENSNYVSQREEKLRNINSDLEIDNEVILVKRRRAVAKLDDNLQVESSITSLLILIESITSLLSPAGIPKLRRVSSKKLKLHGKGHEVRQLKRLATTY